MKIILSIVPEIWSMTDRIFFHFGPFLYFYPSNNPENQHFEKNENCIWRCHHFTHVHHKWKSYDVLFLRYGAWQTELFPISDYFLPFYPPNNPENQNFEKMKKPLEISSFYTSVPKIMVICYTISEIWRVTNLIIFIVGYFLSFYPSKSPKNQNLKKLKKTRLDKPACSWDMASNGHNRYFSFWDIFCPFTPPSLTAKKLKLRKNEKNAWRYHHFTHVYQKLWSNDVLFLGYGARRTEGQTDGRTEKVTYRGGCPT